MRTFEGGRDSPDTIHWKLSRPVPKLHYIQIHVLEARGAAYSGWAGGVTRSAKNFNYKSQSFSERLPLSSVTQTLTSKVDFAIVPHFKDYAA